MYSFQNLKVEKDSIKSTYTYLYEWAERNPSAPTGMVLEVSYQEQGRGQKGNQWFSSDGSNLLPSILIKYPHLSIKNQWYISEQVSVQIVETLKKFIPRAERVSIKWPNDIYYEDKKICGILIGHSLESKYIKFSIVGIGLNVNEDNFPSNLPNPIALKQILGKEISLDEVRQVFYSNLLDVLNFSFSSKDINTLHAQYMSLLYQFNIWRKYQETQTSRIFEGRIIGVNPFGLLEIETLDGEIRQFTFKEIAYIHE